MAQSYGHLFDNPYVDFDKPTEDLKKLLTYKNVKIYISDGPGYPEQLTKYLFQLLKKNIRVVARTNGSCYRVEALEENGIIAINLSDISHTINEEEVSHWGSLLSCFREESGTVAVAIQGYEHASFAIAYGLMMLGMVRGHALDIVFRLCGWSNRYHYAYLRKVEEQMVRDREQKRRLKKDLKRRQKFLLENDKDDAERLLDHRPNFAGLTLTEMIKKYK